MNNADLATLIAKEFPLTEEIMYLNHAAVAPWPKRTADAVTDFATENCLRGAQHYLKWLHVESQLRIKLKRLISAGSTEEIALTKSTSEALSFVAYGINWQTGDEIVISDQEFPSNRIVWESLQEKLGVKIITANISAASNPEQAIIKELTPNTRLVSISSVQYGTGLKLQLGVIGNELRTRNILFCVDAIQSVGISPINVEKDHIDFLMADGHKWMLGPEGLALFYVRKKCQDLLSLNEYGWHMVKNRGDYTRKTWQVADDATRFECGSPNMVSIHALDASLSLILEVGIECIAEIMGKNINFLHEELRNTRGVAFISDLSEHRSAGILTFTIDSVDAESMQALLMRKGVICAYRGGGIRFSPHFYTSQYTLTKAVKTLNICINELSR